MKIFKKYIAAMLIFALALSLCSCSLIDRLKPAPAPETVRLTFPEGTTAIQAAQKLEEGGVCTKDEFIAAVNDASRENKFVQSIKNPQERPFLLEGYIYPDTYDFYVGEGAEKALGRFLSNTESKLTDEMYKKAEELGMSMDEVITLASIIQQEASVPSVMAKVSSVLHNRLNSPSYPRLQCDATIFYLKRSVKPYIGEEQADKYDEFYNTYDRKGLPSGPITNPGIEAINAALNPADTEYYFFVTDNDGNYYFAKTYREHLENCKTAGVGQ